MSLDSFAWQLTQLSAQKKRPLLVITKHNRELAQLKKSVHFFNPSLPLLTFCDWETLPYERISPSLIHITQRLQTLNQLSSFSEGVIITTSTGLLQRLAPVEYVKAYVFQFTINDPINLTDLNHQLMHCGYQRVSSVTLPGEFCIRGEVIDIFSLERPFPFRIHIDIDTIENLYYFDPTTYQPLEPIHSIQIIPTREFLLSDDSISRFQNQGKRLFGSRWTESTVSQQLSTTSYSAGTEYYLPFFFEETGSLLDYLPRHTQWLTDLNLYEALNDIWGYINKRYTQLNSDLKWPIIPPESLYQPPSILMEQLNTFKAATVKDFITEPLPDVEAQYASDFPHKLQQFLATFSSPYTKVLFCITRLSQKEQLRQQLLQLKITPRFTSTWSHFVNQTDTYQMGVTPIKKGFWMKSQNLLLIPDTALYLPPQFLQRKEAKHNQSQPKVTINDLGQLRINEYVVHVDHGIGQYLGMERLTVNQQCNEFIILGYAENTKLYVPIQDIRYISPYSAKENPSLAYLNSNQWKKTKNKAFIQLKDTAAELLQLYAQRAKAKGDILSPPNSEYQAFVESFAFEETKDQQHAIEAITKDLCHEKPMDHLLCGDVGFGKTEVAMRAAFLAVQSNKQVVILAPTTLLVEQHYRHFRERFNDWPIQIDWLSRFRTTADTRKVKASLVKGTIDIIIGTHALLSKDIAFKNLGLFIIDEEHHFGVQQKEHLKKLKTHINVLTLTATPIPRTLQTALSGLRSFSLITTPPKGRLPIKNFINQYDLITIQEAITRELIRGGQVYFVHNRISSLSRVARELKALVPEARIGVAHGKLTEIELETCMNSFYQQDYNLLICTSIIETGLDIPTANTLIVDRADHFGLAQLYQLRGRIGRSHHQAYAYFLISDESYLRKDAQKRLDALNSLSQLGSGFTLATQDLDIRGAGELLGERQSGTLAGIGFSLYMELLDKTIKAIQIGEKDISLENVNKSVSIDLKVPAFIPDSYLADVSIRLQYYQRISNASNAQDIQLIQLELLDQYGALPEEAQNLFAITTLKQMAHSVGIAKIESNHQGGWIDFTNTTTINPDHIIKLVQQTPEQFQLSPNLPHAHPRLRFIWNKKLSFKERITQVKKIVECLL